MHRLTQPLAARTVVRALSLASLVLALLWPSLASAQTIPADAQNRCPISSTTFKSWFKSGSVALNGVVNPANSVTLDVNHPNCPFYLWSEQMFLWLTSPAVAYGGGAHVVDSEAFYDVSPVNAAGKRTLIKHEPGLIRNFSVRAAQAGVHGLPVIMDTKGNLIEFKRAAPEEKPLVKNTVGKLVPVLSAERSVSRALVLKDTTGTVIAPAIRAPLSPQMLKAQQLPTAQLRTQPAKLFNVNGIHFLLDSTGNVIETEEGQAGGDGVLLTQGSSLVYYVSMVNDVYAYFLTMSGTQNPNTTNLAFPTSAASRDAIVNYAHQHGATITDGNALAVEVKSSWVRADSLPNNGDGYITMKATVATYNTTDHAHWTPTGHQENVLLAMVGMHVVGSTVGHPEMVWATFEHFGNAPAAAYSYVNNVGSGQVKPVAQSTAGTWLLTHSNSSGPFNTLRAFYHAPDIFSAACTQTPPNTPVTCPSNPTPIEPSDTLRMNPWGSTSAAPNPLSSAAQSNSEIISVHNNVIGQLPAADIRNHYFMTGSTWTIGGANPSGSFPGGNAVGTSHTANTSMETYQQGANCLDCHSNINSGATANVTISHMFTDILPLP